VVAVQAGTVNPGNIYIVCAHLDDMPEASVAPGADDNASGSTAVLLASSIMRYYAFENTIRYVLFTGEEQGLDGSYSYVQECAAAGDNILGALNFDMISYDADGDGRAEVYGGTMPASGALVDLFLNTVSTYAIALAPVKFTTGSEGWSDHASFWDAGYPAILGIEDNGDDFNPYYHAASDRRVHCNLFYATNYVKAAVGTAARLAVPVSAVTPGPTPTPSPTPDHASILTIEASPDSLAPGEAFTLGVSVRSAISSALDVYFLADTPYGVFTVFLDGSFALGIEALYDNLPGLRAPQSATIFNEVTIPALIPGTYTFYAGAVEAGEMPPVAAVAEVTPYSPHVLALATKAISIR